MYLCKTKLLEIELFDHLTGSNGIERVLHIPQSSIIIGASPSDGSVSYPEHSLEESYSSAKMQSVYSTALADKAITNNGLLALQLKTIKISVQKH